MRPIERARAFFSQPERDQYRARFAYHCNELILDDRLTTLMISKRVAAGPRPTPNTGVAR